MHKALKCYVIYVLQLKNKKQKNFFHVFKEENCLCLVVAVLCGQDAPTGTKMLDFTKAIY